MTYIICRQKNANDKLFDGLNKYHPKVNVTIETIQIRFLDKKDIYNNGMIETSKPREKNKLSTPWASNITEKKPIMAELYRTKYIHETL